MLLIKQSGLPQLGPPRPNWTPVSRVTITNCCGYDSKLLKHILDKQGYGPLLMFDFIDPLKAVSL